MIDAVAYLPEPDVPAGIRYLQQNIPVCANTDQLLDLLTYFDTMHVSGPLRRVRWPATDAAGIPRLVIRRLQPIFPPPLWTVHDTTLNSTDRTNNLCEVWNRGFSLQCAGGTRTPVVLGGRGITAARLCLRNDNSAAARPWPATSQAHEVFNGAHAAAVAEHLSRAACWPSDHCASYKKIKTIYECLLQLCLLVSQACLRFV